MSRVFLSHVFRHEARLPSYFVPLYFLTPPNSVIVRTFWQLRSTSISSEVDRDGKKVVARNRRLHHPCGEHRLELFRHERLLSFLRARVRLEPHGNFGRFFSGAN